MTDHPNKHIRKALKYAKGQGWTIKKSGPRAHAWGVIYCRFGHTKVLDGNLLDAEEPGETCP